MDEIKYSNLATQQLSYEEALKKMDEEIVELCGIHPDNFNDDLLNKSTDITKIFMSLRKKLKEISMKKYYFTFGFGQVHANCYTVIEAENSEEARREMTIRWGRKWSMQYNSAEEAGVERFNLKEIT